MAAERLLISLLTTHFQVMVESIIDEKNNRMAFSLYGHFNQGLL
ncbi:hypothetical protein HMPREF1565_1137 [Providencia alcalifaciens RIMD 1656011]|uniref:Uncharacterized protein n=1 Tax=Providencia alcalifaciens DSM 30120 TaxID=520999 RepID=B6XD80_9GAMM|nr:hypothetical protein PROVALCAL_01302 [Providencia alcalifaciens DSM 30120]ETT06693.1 hypothetical protein HMPREF1562_4201 [Providencia alcalifaciens F90-2004]EUD05176.1 hypothetical protein HMPREF1565_1137 [Providencia alcalifaciens RIMD 1656011]